MSTLRLSSLGGITNCLDALGGGVSLCSVIDKPSFKIEMHPSFKHFVGGAEEEEDEEEEDEDDEEEEEVDNATQEGQNTWPLPHDEASWTLVGMLHIPQLTVTGKM